MDQPTPEIIEAFKSLIERGTTRIAAAQYLGISKHILSRWLERAVLEPYSLFGDFRLSIHIAEANLEHKLVSQIVDASEQDWKAATWVLQNHPIYGQRWGKKQTTTVKTSESTVQIYIPDNRRNETKTDEEEEFSEDMFSEEELID